MVGYPDRPADWNSSLNNGEPDTARRESRTNSQEAAVNFFTTAAITSGTWRSFRQNIGPGEVEEDPRGETSRLGSVRCAAAAMTHRENQRTNEETRRKKGIRAPAMDPLMRTCPCT